MPLSVLSKKIIGSTSQETAYLTLRHAAIIGALEPAKILTIRGLSQSLEMSATPVREALRRLCAERAFVMLENRRVMVPQMSKSRFEELMAARIAIETHAAARALPYINDRRIELLEDLDHKVDYTLTIKEHEQTVITNQAFHTALYETNPEQVLMPIIESLWLQLGPFLRIAAVSSANELVVDYHKEAIEALKSRDESKLRLAIEKDIRLGIPNQENLDFSQ